MEEKQKEKKERSSKLPVGILEHMFNTGLLSEKGVKLYVKKLKLHGADTLKEERERWLSENPPEPLKRECIHTFNDIGVCECGAHENELTTSNLSNKKEGE